MTESLFLLDAYRREAPGRVLASSPEEVVLDTSLLYAASGGQPGDTGRLDWSGGSLGGARRREGRGRGDPAGPR